MASNEFKWYCVACKKVTDTYQVMRKVTKNAKNVLVGLCSSCHKQKATFCKAGRGVVNNILNSGMLPELHLPGHKYAGPGTRLKERMLRDDVPKNELDAAAKEHDMAYAIFKETKDRHVFDKRLQNKAFSIAKSGQHSLKDRLEAGLVGGVMLGKRKLGLGID